MKDQYKIHNVYRSPFQLSNHTPSQHTPAHTRAHTHTHPRTHTHTPAHTHTRTHIPAHKHTIQKRAASCRKWHTDMINMKHSEQLPTILFIALLKYNSVSMLLGSHQHTFIVTSESLSYHTHTHVTPWHHSVHHLESDGTKPGWTESDKLQTQREFRMRDTHTHTHCWMRHTHTHSLLNETHTHTVEWNTHTHTWMRHTHTVEWDTHTVEWDTHTQCWMKNTHKSVTKTCPGQRRTVSTHFRIIKMFCINQWWVFIRFWA